MATFEEVELVQSIAEKLHVDPKYVGVSIGCNLVVVGIALNSYPDIEDKIRRIIPIVLPQRLSSCVVLVNIGKPAS
jgi:hypothetical protein